MAAMGYNFIEQLSDENVEWVIKVRVIRMWRKKTTKGKQIVNMILLDEQVKMIYNFNVYKFYIYCLICRVSICTGSED